MSTTFFSGFYPLETSNGVKGSASFPNSAITIGEDGIIDGIGTEGVNVDNRGVVPSGILEDIPDIGSFIGQVYFATDTRELYRWNGTNWTAAADTTAVAQRSIDAQFPTIQINEGEAGHTGSRTVTHTAKRGLDILTGGTWTLQGFNLGSASVTINSSTGTVTLSGILISGSYTVRYTHTDSLAVEQSVNVVYMPADINGTGGNFIYDSVSGESWSYSNSVFSPSTTGDNLYERYRATFLGEGVIWFISSSLPALERGAVQAGTTYYFSAWFYKTSTATGNIIGRVELYNAAGSNIGVEDIPGTGTSGGPTDTWYKLQGQWTCPAGVSYVRPLVGNNTGGTSNTIFVALPYFGQQQQGADVTATAQRSIESQFPVIEVKEGEAGHTGDRTVTHVAKKGTTVLTGGTWSLPTVNLGTGSATVTSSTGTVTLSNIVQSGAYSIRYTHSDGIATDLPVNVTYFPLVGAGVGNTAVSVVKPFSSTSFTAITNEMSIAIPSSITTAELIANAIILEVPNEFPAGVTNVEAKWQIETTPGTWIDVGSVASSSPSPGVFDEGGFPSPILGEISCNRTATGLTGGSTRKFRLVARVSGGVTRTVTPFGTTTVGA